MLILRAGGYVFVFDVDMTILLFDIDGTLVQVTDGAREAVHDAISTTAGVDAVTEGVSFSGRTDPAIFRDLLRKSGVSDPDPVLSEVLDRYARAAQNAIQPGSVKPLPGIPTLLSRLQHRESVILGLVTGNIERVAYHKLERAGIAAPFATGAFGSDHADRNELPGIALERIVEHHGDSVSRDNVIIIGDTRHDIDCARAAGMCAVAVCTGRFTRQELARHDPDLLLDTMADAEIAIEQILRI